MAQKDPEKKMPSTHAKATSRYGKWMGVEAVGAVGEMEEGREEEETDSPYGILRKIWVLVPLQTNLYR